MNAETMWEILRKDFGICSKEEFDSAFRNFKGLDIGIFTTPLGGKGNEGRSGEDNQKNDCCGGYYDVVI